jgi:hypothetical protein
VQIFGGVIFRMDMNVVLIRTCDYPAFQKSLHPGRMSGRLEATTRRQHFIHLRVNLETYYMSENRGGRVYPQLLSLCDSVLSPISKRSTSSGSPLVVPNRGIVLIGAVSASTMKIG